MKISELSQATQTPVPTIKFYIRQGLVPAGERTSRNQAEYGTQHVERLALIRALQEAAGLRLDTIARALHAADTAKEHFVIAAIDALDRPVASPAADTASEVYSGAERVLLGIIKRRAWKLTARDVSVRAAINALVVVKQWFMDEDENALEPYVEAADRLAQVEIPDDWQPDASREAALKYALLGTVLFEPLILALRRMAHVARTRKVVGSGKPRKGR
jgi:DNA-binding transcriptional MerR regulator